MKVLKLSMGVLFALLLVFSFTQKAFAISAEGYCEINSGSWVGDGGSSNVGTCTYPPGNEMNYCEGDGESLVVTYAPESEPTEDCLVVDSGSPETGGPVETDTHHSGTSSLPPVLSCTIAAGPWRCSFFAEGTCAVNCYIDPHLPAGPAHDLPESGVFSTLYVNISPDPGGSYVVCMENPDNEPFTIYQYLGGAWVALAISTNNPICASASGDGSFYLGS